ncbi:VTT domain-containing protein [Niallia sp. XMNu-256]|uniref:TVP38/TMEM64 family protein n=1 Tax=Niallia sp. XMNu-256 TaxID=3082444 RepID=UPI0030D2CC3E
MIILLLIIFVYQSDWYEMLKAGNFDSIVRNNVWSIAAFTLIMMVIQNTFTIIPLILVITVNYILLGFINGFLWSWFTSLVGSAVIFVGTRTLFQDWVIRKVDQKLLDKIEQKEFMFVFQARIIPFVPTSLINIIGGISSIKFNSFMLATALGNFIYFFILILIPAGLLNIQLNKYLLEGIVLLFILLLFIIKRRKKLNIENKKVEINNTKPVHVHDEESIHHE